MSYRTTILAVALTLGACAAEDVSHEGSQLLVPVEVEFPWNEAYNDEGDGRTALVPIDIMVYDGMTGEPVYAELELRAPDVLFVSPDQIATAEFDGRGEACSGCLWDAYRDEFVAPLVEPDAPLTLATDADGMARVYAVIDEVPYSGTDFDAMSLTVVLGDQEEVVGLVPR